MPSTKIDLEFPYSEDYKSGYLNINKEPRRVVLLVRNDGTQTSTSYARYLMSCHLGYYISDNLVVDHVDDNKLNDCIENYQLLTPSENKAKGRSRAMVTLTCPICNREFIREVRNINHKLSKGKKPSCSRICGGKQAHLNKFGPVSALAHNELKP